MLLEYLPYVLPYSKTLLQGKTATPFCTSEWSNICMGIPPRLNRPAVSLYKTSGPHTRTPIPNINKPKISKPSQNVTLLIYFVCRTQALHRKQDGNGHRRLKRQAISNDTEQQPLTVEQVRWRVREIVSEGILDEEKKRVREN